MSTATPKTYLDFHCPIPSDWLSFLYSNKNDMSQLLDAGLTFDILRIQNQIPNFVLRIPNTQSDFFENQLEYLKSLSFSSAKTSNFQVSRFGGDQSGAVVMEYLMKCSKAILTLVRDHNEVLEYEDLISFAVFMGKAYFQNMQNNEEWQKKHLTHYYQNWSALLPDGINLSKIKIGYSEEVGILKTVEQLKPIQTWSNASQIFFDAWSLDSNNLAQQLRELDSKNLLEQRDQIFKYDSSLNLEDGQNLLEIQADCFHFALNKLGINNEDEALIIYLISELMGISLEDV